MIKTKVWGSESLVSALIPATEERMWANYLTPLSLIKRYMCTLLEYDKMAHDRIAKCLTHGKCSKILAKIIRKRIRTLK